MSKGYHVPSKLRLGLLTPTQLDDLWSNLVVLSLLALVIFGIWSFFDPKAWYVIRYGVWEDVSHDNIYVAPKPHDCDFDAAPLGSKNCHFDSQVEILKPTFYRLNNKLLASYDGGVTTFEVTAEDARKMPKTINVSWKKIAD